MKRIFPSAVFWAAALFQIGAPLVGALETTYWVWNRKAPLSGEETRILTEQGVRKLYWHAATLRPQGEGWRLEAPLEAPQKTDGIISLAPVLRLTAEGGLPLGDTAVEAVSQALMEAAHRTNVSEAQIDFDCPDRKLGEYAGFLAKCRARIAPIQLSATALAGWSKAPAFGKLQESVDRLLPMFYDLEPDSPARVSAGDALPLADASRLVDQIASWRSCRIPWLAGLPNFARVTIFDQNGRSRGHLRAWDWDELCFNPALALRSASPLGVTMLRVESDTVMASTAVSAGESIACRWPDLAQLAQGIACAEASGAVGVAIFRLPGEGSQSAWSLRQLDTLLRSRKAEKPQFELRRTERGLELVNVSASDLAPRLAGKGGDHDRGWQLEVESSAGSVFREASPGEFANVFGHTDPDSAAPERVRIPLAERLTYWFAELRAGRTRQTGLLLLAPGADVASLRWRVPGSPRNSEWQSLP